MGAYENIADKIVLLLEKTRDTLLKDLEKEFSGLRKALERLEYQTKGSPSDLKDALETTRNIFDGCEQVVKAVFAQVGVDISHCDNAESFTILLSKPLALVDNLADDIGELTGDGEPDYAAIAQSAFKTLQDLIQLVNNFQNVEMDKISDELEKAVGDAWEKFDLKDFAMSILEYILITILRNGREVFADEIKYVKLQANALYTQIDSAVKDVRGKIEGEIDTYLKEFEKDANQAASLAKTLFRESVDDMEDVYDSLAQDVKKDINTLLKSKEADEIREVYEKVSGILSKTYAILDFFGVVGTKTVEIKLPQKFISKLQSAAKTVIGAIDDAGKEIGGYVKDLTEEANGTISYASGMVREVAGPAHEQIQKAAGLIDSLTDTSFADLDITADLVNLPAVSIPDFSADIEAAGSALSGTLSKYVGGGINFLQGFSFPISIPTFRWEKVEKMFIDPEAYFLEQYPVDSIEDAEAIATKVIDIVRLFNPDIPDFSSIRGMLESLLKELGEKVLAYAKDAADEAKRELWTHVKPLMTMIRKVLDLLEEMYEALKRDAHTIIQEIKRSFIQDVVNPVTKDAQHAVNEVKDFVDALKKQIDSIKAPDTMQKVYEEIVCPSILEAVEKSEAPDPEALADGLAGYAKEVMTAWGTGVYTHVTNFLDEKAWKERLDNTIAALETTFAGDVSAVKSFLTPSSLDDIRNMGGRFSDLKSSLDISQYIKIISEAFDNVSVPNPELYFEGFKQAIFSILDRAQSAGAKFKAEQVRTFAADIAAGVWEKVRNKVLKPLVREIKKQVLKTVRKVVSNALNQIIDQLPSFRDIKAASELPAGAAMKMRLYTNRPEERITDVKNLSQTITAGNNPSAPGGHTGTGGGGSPAPSVSTKEGNPFDVDIAKDWLVAAKDIALASVAFSESDKTYADVISLVAALYKSIPESAKDYIADILPSLPDNEFTKELSGFFKQMDYKGDLDKTFAILTVVNMKTDKDKDAKDAPGDTNQKGKSAATAPTPEKDDGKAKFKASALLQFVVFAGEIPVKKKEEASAGSGGGEGPDQASEPAKTQTGNQTGTREGSKTGQGEGKNGEKKEEEKEPALFFTVILRGEAGLTFSIGEKHTMSISVSGGTGSGEVKTIDEKTSGALQKGIGFHITKDWEFHGDDNWESLNAMFFLDFKRKMKGDKNDPLEVFDTKYLSMKIGNYPQLFYLGYGKSHPAEKLKDFGVEDEKAQKDGKGNTQGGDTQGSQQSGKQGSQQGGQQGGGQGGKQGGDGKMPEGNKFQVGYIGAVKEALVSLHLQEVPLVKEVIKDDVDLKFDTYLWYDYHKGFDFGGNVSLHLDYDLDHKKFGPLVIDSFTVDAGTPEGEDGKLFLTVGTTFQVEFTSAMVVAVENLGAGFRLNYKDEDGDFGDLDLDASFQFPTGFGVSIDASVVKGGGFVSIDPETNEFLGALSLDIMKKIGVGAYLLCDPGTAKGHEFSMVVLLSATFTPGIPIGMGFSLTAVGGTLGLNRQISRDAISNGVRTGTLDQVFFVKDYQEHLAEMKSNLLSYFPPKHGQFFFGLLGQISFEPVVKCDFGLLLQLPSPLEVIIVGALRVNAAEGIVQINVYFAGGINFDEGMWFDASIVDSQIVGLSISGDMAFRLNWGGQKGFLLSIGGFHPAYKPEAGLNVGKMNRLAMKLDYSILKLSFETYMAITSNTFQIGARFDLKIGWDKFGISGYAGFDALFQFDPFMFMFSACAGVSVKCGSWSLLSIALSLDVQGPAPWRVSGEAHFSFLLIPIDVSFTKVWGEQAPELPSKLVAVLPILKKEWEKASNWTVDNSDITGKTVVVLFGHKTDELVIQPEGSLTFNQSALPLMTESLLDRMDLCDDAVPEDYDILAIKTVNKMDDKEFLYAENDFAPALYKKMSIQEKLSSASYVKYHSGFTMDKRENRQSTGKARNLVRHIIYEAKSLSEQENTGITDSVVKSNASQVVQSQRKAVTPGGIRVPRPVVQVFEEKHPVEGVANNRRDRVAFDRYIARLDRQAALKNDTTKR